MKRTMTVSIRPIYGARDGISWLYLYRGKRLHSGIGGYFGPYSRTDAMQFAANNGFTQVRFIDDSGRYDGKEPRINVETVKPQANPLEVLYSWKDAEIDYCRSLVMTSGTQDVPDWAIDSYLSTQIVSARKDNRADCVDYLEKLQKYWRNSARYLAQLSVA